MTYPGNTEGSAELCGCMVCVGMRARTKLDLIDKERLEDAATASRFTHVPLRLDLGCGPNKKEGWTGVDVRPFPGVDVVLDLVKFGPDMVSIGSLRWPWPSGSVDEAQASHLVEHFTGSQRIHFVNELYRVLKPGAKALIITPHWASCRAYGDLTHQWPPVSEMWFAYLSAAWRAKEAPHNDAYTCDFESTYGYGINPKIQARSLEFQQWALEFYKESAMDLVATLTKPVKKVAP